MSGPVITLLAFIAVVVVLAVVIGFLFASRSRKQGEQRVEAAGIRSDAETLGAAATGQTSFAEQSEERAGVARAVADGKVREAEALESEASAHRDEAEATRREYEAQLRRADEIDPDVDDSSLPPVEEVAQTRGERRAAREEAEAEAASAQDPAASPTTDYWATTAPGIAALGGGAMAPSGSPREDHEGDVDSDGEQSARVASAADYRDDVKAVDEAEEAGPSDPDVYVGGDRGTGEGMTQTQESSASDHEHEYDDQGTEPGGAQEAGGMAIIADPEQFAATEPVSASDQSAPVQREDTSTAAEVDTGTDGDGSSVDDDGSADGIDGADGTDGTDAAREGAGGSTEESFDPTPTRDWASEEGELLEETHERGDRLAQGREDLEAADGSAGTAEHGGEETSGETKSGDDTSGGEASGSETARRRVSSFTELRDGGFGVGSAAPLDDGGQPLDHPVQAYRDTMTFRAPGDGGYDSAEPDVWFYDEGAAERNGFTRSEG